MAKVRYCGCLCSFISSNIIGDLYSETVFRAGLVLGHEANCDYLDTSQIDNTGYIDCHGNGCCGKFEDRYCCKGPIVTVAVVFGVLFGTLVIGVVAGVVYAKYKHKKVLQNQVVPRIVADRYDDVPLPSPPVRAPPVYNTARLHPPAFTPQPFKNLKHFDHDHPPPSNLHPPRLHILK